MMRNNTCVNRLSVRFVPSTVLFFFCLNADTECFYLSCFPLIGVFVWFSAGAHQRSCWQCTDAHVPESSTVLQDVPTECGECYKINIYLCSSEVDPHTNPIPNLLCTLLFTFYFTVTVQKYMFL